MSYNTTFITADAFMARYGLAKPGATFSYAKGDLAVVCQYEAEAEALRQLTHKLVAAKKIHLTQRVIPDTTMRGGGRAFEYFATKATLTPNQRDRS